MSRHRYIEVDGRWVEVADQKPKSGDMPARSSLPLRAGIIFALAVICAGIFKGCGSDEAPLRTDSGTRLVPPWPAVRLVHEQIEVSKDLLAKNYYVVFDGSGSMKDQACSGAQSKLATAKAAVAAFAQSVPADANLGLQVFDRDGVRERVPLGTGNRERFMQQVNAVKASGNTPLRESVNQAYDKLLHQGMKQLGYGEYHLVIVTDGEADGGQDPGIAVHTLLSESPVVMHTIGFCIGNKHSLNQPGRTLYQPADDADQLARGLADVLAEAPQFTLSKFK